MVKRDFTDKTEQELLKMADQVAPQHGWMGQAADWVGDKALGLQQYLSGFDMSDPMNQSDGYYHKVMDLNNASKKQIKQIWSKVDHTDSQYTIRFSALDTALKDLKTQIDNLANTIDPSGGNFTVQSINSQLKPQIDDYTQESAIMQQIADKGVTEKDLQGKSQDQLNTWFSHLAGSYANSVPNVKVGATLVVPLGPDLSITIKNSGAAKDGGPLKFDVSVTLKDNAATLKRMCSTDPKAGGVVFDKNGNPIDEDGEGKWQDNGIKPDKHGITRSWSRTKNGKTETITVTTAGPTQASTISYGVSTDVNNATVSSEISLEVQHHSNWKPLNPHSVKPQTPPLAVIRKAWKKLPPYKKILIVTALGLGVVTAVFTDGADIPEVTKVEEFILAA